MHVERITYQQAKPWVLGHHYAKRMPSISFAFGAFIDGVMVGVVTFGKPASPWLCKGVCGDENRLLVYELNRLIVQDGHPNTASALVGGALRQLPGPMVVVSYADTQWGHIGYVYQATNFLYTGCTKGRTDMASAEGKHSRHYPSEGFQRVNRSPKHRYVAFVGNRRDKQRLKSALRYPVMPYPKGDTQRYDAGW